MTDEERHKLICDIEELVETIEKLEPQVFQEEAKSGGQESINRQRLIELRTELARKTELLQQLDK
jgi:hypothetical protein